MIAFSGIGVFSMKRTKSVVSLMYDSCFLAMGCRSESIKLEMRSVVANDNNYVAAKILTEMRDN